MMLRIEAGLPLVDVEWHNSRTAFTDHQRVTPTELGMGWMLRGVADGDRAFVGGDAIRRELATKSSRWASVGIVVDWLAWDALHRDAGLLPPKDEHPLPYESVLHDRPTTAGGTQVGYVTSFMYSPVLQKHIGLARVRPDLAAPGTEVHMELAINHSNTTVLARTATTPPVQPREEDGQAMSPDTSSDVRRHRGRRRPQRTGQRRLPRQGGAAHPRARAARPRRRRRHHRGAAPGLLVHDVLLRAEPAASRDHPGARPRAARLHAADDAVVVPPDR